MQLIQFLATGLFPALVSAKTIYSRRGVDCDFDINASFGDTCESFSASWGLSVEDLKILNPGINCPDLNTDDVHCVVGSVNNDPPATMAAPSTTPRTLITIKTSNSVTTPFTTSKSSAAIPSTTSRPSTTTTSAGNGVATPQPTQPGMVSNCNKFHYINKGVSCGQVISYQKITLADFVKWNPTILDNCSGMWAEINVCVGVIGGATTTTTLETTSAKPSPTTSTGNGVQTPRPTQPGMVSNCAKFHFVAAGVTCSQITSYQRIALADLVNWNPTIGSDCSRMQAGVNVCVGLIGGPTTTSKPTTTTKPTTTKSAGNGIQTPQPTQPGMVKNCKKFHYVASGVTCSQITSYNKITLADFVKWNSGVGSGCRNMWANTNVCVGV